MGLDVGKLILAGGVGVVDLFVEVKDIDNGRADPMKRWVDYERVGGLALGLAAQIWFTKYARWGEALAIATTPLVIRSLNDSQQFIKPKAAQARTGRTFTPAGAPVSHPVAQRYPAPEYQNEFKNIKI